MAILTFERETSGSEFDQRDSPRVSQAAKWEMRLSSAARTAINTDDWLRCG
ncbi:hypothetical protein J6590_000116 [Homalodisca vitripennis]|nr:hypothetical protein J6590_000116 [Homalodisca vitripennis]